MKFDDDMDEELRSHVAHRADDLEGTGLTRAEAERRARIEFGARERIKEEIRDASGRAFLEKLRQDARFSVRVLCKSPGFTLVAVATLALAIGANAVVFGVLNGLVLRPLNVPDARSLYGIEHGNDRAMDLSYPDYLDLRDRNRSFEDLAAYGISLAGIDTGDSSSRAFIAEASGNYFDVLHLHPYRGRFFHASDEHGPDSAPYVVLSYAYWHTRFQEDPAAVGRVIRVNRHPFTIIGVAPPQFHGTFVFFSPDLFVPIVNQPQIDGTTMLDQRGIRWIFMTMGHLKAGVTPDRAAADLTSIGGYLEKAYPKEHGKTTFVLGRPGLYGDYLGGPVRAFLTGLMLLAGLILLGACANLGSLFAARAADRSREVALRLALGATRTRILRQLLTEAVLVSLAGGMLGVCAGVALLSALSAWHPFPRWPINIPVSPDANVYVIALVLAVVSGLTFGLVPVRQVLRVDPYQIVKTGAGAIPGRRLAVRDVLLVAQVAICAVLVTASIVAMRGLLRSLHTALGFEPRNAILADTDMNMAGYTGDRMPIVQTRMIDALQTIPEVESVGMSSHLQLAGGIEGTSVYTDTTTDLRPANEAARSLRFAISPEYFRATGTQLVAGRTFSWHDDAGAPAVAIVNRTFAAKLFGSPAQALGGHVKLRSGTRVQVVGIVEDGKYENLTEDPRPAMFLPFLQAPSSQTWLIVRSTRDPEQLADAIRTALRGVDAALPVYVETWNKQLDFALFPSRMATLSLSVMGVMGAMLSVTGIFGMAAYSVSRRLREFGIRIALGARPRALLQAALGRAVKLVAIGSVAGVLLGTLASRVLAAIVYQATSRDPMVLSGAVLVMGLLAVLATWIPARRALSIDPLVLLREE